MTARLERLVLDEMFAPRIADQLRHRGHDVIALVVDLELRALSDPEVYAWAAERGPRVVTENVKDSRLLAADGHGSGLLFTSNRSLPRSRQNLGPLVDALDRWLLPAVEGPRPLEDWLQA